MKTQNERTESSSWMRVRSVAAGFLCVMGLPVALALADVQSSTAGIEGPTVTDAVQFSSMHEAQSGLDIGPGSDEALLAQLPESR
jgi:hypothetical protein